MAKELFNEDDFVKEERDEQKKPVKKNNYRWWLLLLSAVAIVAVLAFFVKECNGDDVPSQQPVEPVEVITDAPEVGDTIVTPVIPEPKIEEPQPKVDKPETDVHLMAKRVIRGDFGNGIARKKALENEYQIIQDQVNANYRKGDLYW